MHLEMSSFVQLLLSSACHWLAPLLVTLHPCGCYHRLFSIKFLKSCVRLWTAVNLFAFCRLLQRCRSFSCTTILRSTFSHLPVINVYVAIHNLLATTICSKWLTNILMELAKGVKVLEMQQMRHLPWIIKVWQPRFWMELIRCTQNCSWSHWCVLYPTSPSGMASLFSVGLSQYHFLFIPVLICYHLMRHNWHV